jgi:hypothetical protein
VDDDVVTESARRSTPSSSQRSVVEVVTCGKRCRRWSEEDRIAALEQMIHAFQSARFGKSAERIDTTQLALTLGQAPAPSPANNPAAHSLPTEALLPMC